MDWRIIADITIGTSIPMLFAILFLLGRVTKREIAFFITGFLIGATFEFLIWFFGPSFFYVRMKWPLPWPTYYICHSLWDAGLFMAGYYLAGIVLKKPRTSLCITFNWLELAVMTTWGMGTAFFVELSGNGVIWQYVPQKWNPVWITVGGQGYTVFIQAIWMVVPSVFYFICIAINRTKKQK